VLLLTAFPAVGGPLPKLAALLAEGLREAGCQVVVEGWSAHTAGRERLGVKVSGRLADLVRVLRFVRTWRPDVVYVASTHNWPALLRDLPLVLCLPTSRPPLVLHLHGSRSDRLTLPGRRVFKTLSRALVRRCAAVLLLSTQEWREWHAFEPAGRYELVMNPFVPPPGASQRTSHDEGRPPVVLTVARLVPEKGIFDLLEAFALVRSRRPAVLRIAGAGPSAQDLRRRVGLLGLEACVQLPGYVVGPALDLVYRDAAIFALPSYFEGFPLSVMEAMAYGLPVVTTPIRGCADALRAGENAVFVPAGDPEALAGALSQLLDDPAARARMGAANAARVGDFAPRMVLPRYLDILRRAVAEAGIQA